MSYKGGSSGYRGNSYGAAEDDSLYVDKNSVVHYAGTPKLAPFNCREGWLCGELKNALHGRAWTLCQWKAEISAQKLLGLSKGSGDGQGPQAAVKLLVGPVRKACEGWPLF